MRLSIAVVARPRSRVRVSVGAGAVQARCAAWWWPESSASSSIPALDGLRALAVMLVLVFHSWVDLPGYVGPGQSEWDLPLNYTRTGVQLFFVLSGFLLFLPYARWLYGLQERPSAWRFYQRRLLRVGPAYWACLGLLALIGARTWARWAGVPFYAAFLQNVFPGGWSPDTVFWTMAVEVQFYALLPLIGWVARHLAGWHGLTPLHATAAVVAGLAAMSALSEWSAMRLPVTPWVGGIVGQTSLSYSMGVFAAGIGTAVLWVGWSSGAARPRWLAELAKLATGVTLGGLALALALAIVPAAHRLPFKLEGYGVAYAALLWGALIGSVWWRRTLEWRPLRFVGLVSYSIYLWHVPAFTALDRFVLEPWIAAGLVSGVPLRTGINLVVMAGACIPVAWLSYHITERPFLAARRRRQDRSTD